MAKRAAEKTLMDRPKMAKLNAWVEDDVRLRLYHALLDDGLDFSKWLRRQIDQYLSEKERGGSVRRGR